MWLLPVLALACARGEPARAPVLLVAVDGLEWSVVGPMLRRGELPHLAGLAERGSAGKLATVRPTLSPVIWTTVATGKRPAEHGIHGFARRDPETGETVLYGNRDRRSKALWNIASERGLRVAVVGWWLTHPVEAIAGAMVAQTNTRDQIDTLRGRAVWKGRVVPGVPGQVHPPELAPRVMSIVDDVERELPALLRETFGAFPHPLTKLSEQLWLNARWSFRADLAYLRVSEALLSESGPFDLVMVYLGNPDVLGHRFWRHREPDRYANPPGPEQVENFGEVLEASARWVDAAVGRLAARLPGANVLVVSDHGMEAVKLARRWDPDRLPDDVSSGHHRRPIPGVIFAAGPGFARRAGSPTKDDPPTLAGVLDVAPTVLALLGLPIGADMPGRLRPDLFAPGALDAVATVATHDSAEWRESHAQLPAATIGEPERIEQLRALGYLGEDSEEDDSSQEVR